MRSGQSSYSIVLGLLRDSLCKAHPLQLLDPMIKRPQCNNEVGHCVRTDIKGDEFAIPDDRRSRRSQGIDKWNDS